jgi:hypothetical protein
MRKTKPAKHNKCSCGEPALTPTDTYCFNCCANWGRANAIFRQMKREHPDWKEAPPQKWIDWFYEITERIK